MKLRIKNTAGKVVKSVQVRDDVFDAPMNRPLVQQVVVGQLANARQGTAKVKTRGQVSGGGKETEGPEAYGDGAGRLDTVPSLEGWRDRVRPQSPKLPA